MKVSQFISELVPYVPGKPIDETKRQYGIMEVYKLASNENPLGPSLKALDAISSALVNLNLYPDGSCFELRQKASRFYGVSGDWLAFGNGSDEIVDLLVRVYCEAGDKILTSHRAFDTYRLSAQTVRCETTRVPMTEDLRFDLAAMAAAWTPQHKIIFITNPNNPTGTYCTRTEMDQFLARFGNRDDVIIVVDEAYFEFVRAKDYASALEYTKKYKNVVTLRTLSKVYGLAGLRLGIMIAQSEITALINKVRKPFNVNSLMQAAAVAAFDDVEFVEKTQEIVWAGIDYFYKELKKMGLKYWPTQGNFVLFDTGRDSTSVHEKLLRRGLILRPVKNYDLPTHLRISVGLPFENQFAMNILKEVLA